MKAYWSDTCASWKVVVLPLRGEARNTVTRVHVHKFCIQKLGKWLLTCFYLCHVRIRPKTLQKLIFQHINRAELWYFVENSNLLAPTFANIASSRQSMMRQYDECTVNYAFDIKSAPNVTFICYSKHNYCAKVGATKFDRLRPRNLM